MKNKNIIIFIAIIVFLGIGLIFFLRDEEEKTLPGEKEELSEKEFKEEDIKEFENVIKKGKEIDSLYYQLKESSPEGIIVVDFWKKGDKLKIEMDIGGLKTINLIDKEGDVYTYNAGSRKATILPGESKDRLYYYDVSRKIHSLNDYDLDFVAIESIEEKRCFVIEYEDEMEEMIKMWIWEEKGLPIKIKEEAFGGERVIEVSEIEINDISDEVFEIPSHMEVTDEMIFY